MTASNSPSLQEQVLELLRSLNQAWLAGRFGELGGCFHEDVVVVPPGFQQRMQGRDPCVQSYRKFATHATVLELNTSMMQVNCWGETAVASYRFEITYRRGGKELKEAGREIFVLIRENRKVQAVWRTMVLQPA